jgi:[acyl-carrier-protein] S-malonyltransferase
MIAVVFPGQGSQKAGMGRELAVAFPRAMRVFDETSMATGIDVKELCWDSDEEFLRRTENAQLALFTVSLAAFTEFSDRPRVSIQAVAGHSVGEFAALVAAGVLTIEDGARLVRARGEAMAEEGKKQPGSMAAVLGLGVEELQRICAETEGTVVIANDNSPGQVVISGDPEAVANVGTRAVEAGAKRVIPLNVSGAFHSPLMQSAATLMKAAFESCSYAPAHTDIYSNVSANVEREGFGWPDLLERQLLSPVRWTEIVQRMAVNGIDKVVECGVGEVLSGLIRRTEKGMECFRVNDPASLEAAVTALSDQ